MRRVSGPPRGAPEVAVLKSRTHVLAARQQAHENAWLAGRSDGMSRTRVLHAAHLADPGVSAPFDARQYVPGDALSTAQSAGAAGGQAAVAAGWMLAPLRAAGGFLNPAFDLANDGLIRGEIRARVAPPAGAPAPFDTPRNPSFVAS